MLLLALHFVGLHPLFPAVALQILQIASSSIRKKAELVLLFIKLRHLYSSSEKHILPIYY